MRAKPALWVKRDRGYRGAVLCPRMSKQDGAVPSGAFCGRHRRASSPPLVLHRIEQSAALCVGHTAGIKPAARFLSDRAKCGTLCGGHGGHQARRSLTLACRMAESRKRFASFTSKGWLKLRDFSWRSLNRFCGPFKRAALRRRTGLKINLGCGDRGCPGFVNVDARHTSATDVTMDLSRPRFTPDQVRVCFSHAFFEHLLRNDRLPHLRAIYEALESGGVIFTREFRILRTSRGSIWSGGRASSDRFSISSRLCYTHGDPEAVGWYMAQWQRACSIMAKSWSC